MTPNPQRREVKRKTFAEAEVLRWRALVDDPNATDWAPVREIFSPKWCLSTMVNDPLLYSVVVSVFSMHHPDFRVALHRCKS